MEAQVLTITALNAQNAFNKANSEIKKTLQSLWPDHNFNRDITEMVDSYEAACELEGITQLTIADFEFLPEQDREYHFVDHQLNIIHRALNEGWTWKEGERGYYPVFNRAAGGSGFSLGLVGYCSSSSTVGARRTYKDERLAMHSAKKFLHLHSVIQNNE
ncbi:hypothetical protein DYBT9275_02736 [Dyadobacter sp. CECT 9275]|uniref:Uncharacterized protein n=1 Tax=Dyadobacter helix TaxID=2822344 RepID=A0A916NLM2_9BACT|nr:hypothetical protein [Dyadobacter sp. CECT 9275]CAG5001759.1 hypothetical protein DYBT9275_02736 [Dyadobacter sp. CECT 9275]